MAVVNQERIRTANVRAMTDLRLLALPISLFDSLMQRFPRLRENLMNLVDERLVG